MSSVMLHGVLNMPEDLCHDEDVLGKACRHGYYRSASRIITRCEYLLKEIRKLHDDKVICLPTDVKKRMDDLIQEELD